MRDFCNFCAMTFTHPAPGRCWFAFTYVALIIRTIRRQDNPKSYWPNVTNIKQFRFDTSLGIHELSQPFLRDFLHSGAMIEDYHALMTKSACTHALLQVIACSYTLLLTLLTPEGG